MNLFYCVFPLLFLAHAFLSVQWHTCPANLWFCTLCTVQPCEPFKLLGIGYITDSQLSLFLPFLPHFSLWKWKVYDTSNTHPQPWPSSTLPQSSTTLLIICLSQFCLLVRLSNWCPLPNLTGNYIGICRASSLNPPLFSALLFYGPLLLARSFGSTPSCNSVSDLCLFYNSVKMVTFHGIRRKTVRSELWPFKTGAVAPADLLR